MTGMTWQALTGKNLPDRTYGIAFDGASIWVVNYGSSTVSKL